MTHRFKKTGTLLLALLLALSLTACGGETPSQSTPDAETVPEEAVPENTPEVKETADAPTVRVAALKGPTAMGLVRLMDQSDADGAESPYTFQLAASPDGVTPLLIQGELDAACVPANLAAVLYNRTEGGIVCLGINTLGVLYVVENGEDIQSIADLAGKTVVASGKGSTPEYAFRYLLAQNGLDPDADLTIEWKSEHSECVAALASGAASVALLPQPFVTVAQSRIDGLRTALDLTAEWTALDNGSALVTGVVAARRAFVEEHPEAVERFLADYADSVAWVNENVSEAAELIGAYDIVDAAVAEKALPYCNIVCVTGAEMRDWLSGYLQVLYDAEPDSVGGAVPEADFCYGA